MNLKERFLWILFISLLHAHWVDVKRIGMRNITRSCSEDITMTNIRRIKGEDEEIISRRKCIPTVKLERCNIDFDDNTKWIWRRDLVYSITSKIARSCKNSLLEYTWKMKTKRTTKTLKQFQNKHVFYLRQYTLDTGSHILSLTVSESAKGETKGENTVKCLIKIRPEMPIPIILGGLVRTVSSGTSFMLQGNHSANMDVAPWEVGQLYMKWTCESKPDQSLCKKITNKVTRLLIPSKAAVANTDFRFTLNVCTVNSPWIATEQTVKVRDGYKQVYIKCMKNCEGDSSFLSVIYLKANCVDCKDDNYQWSMEPNPQNQKQSLDFKKETVYGGNDPRLVIKERVLVAGDKYNFTVKYKGGTGEATFRIQMIPLPRKGQCQATPKRGKSLTTLFNFACRDFKHVDTLSYHLFQKSETSNNYGILLAESFDGNFNLYLSPGHGDKTQVKIRAVDINGLSVEVFLDVSVTSEISQVPLNQKIEKYLDAYTGKSNENSSVSSLIDKGNEDGALQLINVFIGEARTIPNKTSGYEDFNLKWKVMILKDLDRVSMDTIEWTRQMAATIKKLSWADKDRIDRKFGNPATKLCRKTANQQLYIVKKMQIVNTEETTSTSLDLKWCADTHMKENLTDLTTEDIGFNITTAFPILTVPVIPEDYPNYDDADLLFAEKLKDYKEIAKNSVDTYKLIGIGIASTLAPGEPMKQLGQKTKIEIMTDTAENIAEKVFGHTKCFVKGSQDLKKFTDSTTSAVVIQYKANPFWWKAEARDVSTDISDINYYIGNTKIKNLRRPLEILCNAKTATLLPIKASVSVPTDLDKWIPEILDYNITVHRVDVRRGSGLFIEFHKLGQKDAIDIVLTYNSRPHTEDFKNARTIHQGNSKLRALFPTRLLEYGDAWFYIGVLPNKSMLNSFKPFRSNTFVYNYSVSFLSATCVHWKPSTEEWSNTACQTGKKTKLDQLHCYCHHESAYSGVYLNASNKIDRLLNISYALSLTRSCVVFIFVCIVFGLYCIALLYDVPEEHDKEIYFLSDNVNYERYGYLVMVKTGNMYSAGTTSNVSIKVFGTKCKSKSHILNYPDPDKSLLQRGGEDYFMLTTEKYLGDIKVVYLWHDSIGFRPSWYCESISVSDLQSDKTWYFQVNRWFSVVKDEVPFLILKPSDNKPIFSWKHNLIRTMTRYVEDHNWNILNAERNDLSYIQKLTIVLSVTLATFVFALIMYGIPTLRLKDGLDYYGHYEVYPFTILVACCSSILSFILHLGFVTSFRKAKKVNSDEAIGEAWKDLLPSYITTWYLLVSSIIFSLTFLIVCGFWLAYVTSLLWISSVIGALIQSILLLENILTFLRFRKSKNDPETKLAPSHIVDECENQRLEFFNKFGGSLLRPYFSTKYRPLNREEWKVKREQQLNRLRLAELVQDLIMFLTYVILLYVVVLANKDELNIYSHSEIKGLIYGEHMRTVNFEEVENIDGFYEYVNETLLPCIHSSNWYGTWEMTEPGLTADFNIKVIGVARFRQLRVHHNRCASPKKVAKFNLTCSSEFSYWSNDRGKYMEYWKPFEYVLVPRLSKAWSYKHDAKPTIGEISVYPGAGYSGALGRTLYNSYYNLKYYMDTSWIDYNTRVVFVEFLSYNANYNIFHAVKLILERSASGLYIKSHSICTTRLLFVKLELETMLLLSFLAFIIIVAIILIKDVYMAAKNFKSFIRETWNLIDIIIVLMSFTCIGIYMYRSYLVGAFLKEVETSRNNHFINYFHLIYLEELFTILAALLICIATIRLWKLLRFGVIFKIMERTLLLSGLSLIAIGTCHLIVVLMYTFSGYILFGGNSYDFRDITSTLTSLMLLSLNLHQQFDFDFIQRTHGGLGYVYYTTYMLITLTITTMYIAAIVIGYTDSRIYYSEKKSYYTVQRYVLDESVYLTERFKRKWSLHQRLRGGTDGNIEINEDNLRKKVTPKSDEYRYADSVIISRHKCNTMSLIARCVFLNLRKPRKAKRRLSRNRMDLMKKTVVHLFSKQAVQDEPVIAFRGYDGKKVKFVSDDRILKMENIVNYILNMGTIQNLKVQEFDKDNEEVLSKKDDIDLLSYFEEVLKSILKIISNIKIITSNDED